MQDGLHTYAHRLGAFGAAYALPSAAIRQQAVLCVLDTVGCTVAGAHTEEAAALRHPARPRPSPVQLARFYGYCADVFELNDLISGHASVGNVSAALALAAEAPVPGADLVAAVAAGIEATSRCYNAFYPFLKPYGECSVTAVGLPSAAGCSIVAGRLLHLSEPQMREAVAIALALANWCPAEVIFGDGGTVKPMLFGAMPASAGIDAASYALAGMTGPPRILEGDLGYYRMAARQIDPTAFDPPTPALSQPRRKAHACCGYLHSALDTIAALRRRGALADPATRIAITLPAYIHPVVAKSAPPVSANDARFHMAYCAAIVADGADVILPGHSTGFEGRFDAALQATMRRISVEPGPALTHYHQSVVSVSSDGAAPVVVENRTPKGSPGNPMSDDEVLEKFRALVRPVAGPAAAAELEAAVLALPDAPNTARLTAALDAALSRATADAHADAAD